jgi:23S rRNA-/tRNA-specific pseudouridylate synthase
VTFARLRLAARPLPGRARERFDPPLLRVRWTAEAALSRDAFLAALRARTGWNAAHVESMLWHGGLHLDGRPHGGDDLPDAIAAGVRIDAYAFTTEPETIPVGAERVLADRADWLAADKPAWLTTQRTRASRRLSFEAALRERTECAALVAVHRLDRETSGVVLFAKTAEAAARLGRRFAEGGVRKRYVAIVEPVPAAAEWEVSGWIGRVLDPQRYRFALRDAPGPGFRFSHSRFTRLDHDGVHALVACEPTTGRSHQLRVHLAASGTPIAGDGLYGGVPADRTLLHAAALHLAIDGEEIALHAPIPPELGTVGSAPGEDAT